MNKTLVLTIEAEFEIADDFSGGLEVINEAIEKLREQGGAKVIDVIVKDRQRRAA